MKLERSDFHENRVEFSPGQLLCLCCHRGGGDCGEKVAALWKKIEALPDLHITMTGAFDEVGARTEAFDNQTPAQRRKDLDVLQRLGLCFGDTRTARDLLQRVSLEVDSLEDICAYRDNEFGAWPECPLAREDFFARGNGPLPPAQSKSEMAAAKAPSCRALEESDPLVIRAHHLLCTVCFAGGEVNTEPLAEDNLFEAWRRFREDPDTLVQVVEGPQLCCICPPCHGFDPRRGLCVAACHLRDRKKDLDTLVALGLSPGDVLTARELYRRIRIKFPDTASLPCAYSKDTSPEWTGCGGTSGDRYDRGIAVFGVE